MLQVHNAVTSPPRVFCLQFQLNDYVVLLIAVYRTVPNVSPGLIEAHKHIWWAYTQTEKGGVHLEGLSG